MVRDMRLAALYSGGKDSTFAMYLARQMGHEIVRLVNIVPSDSASWLFHTPNLDAVPMMSEALDIPLTRVRSDGTEEGDMEALYNALSDMSIDGVVVGAVWSDYQWDRMNRILGELNLVMIAPLWRKEQSLVYDEMLAAGIDAVIVSVAAEGLDESWLGRHLDAVCKNDLKKVSERSGVSIIGEGGEYESMTLDSPMHRKRLEIVSSSKLFRGGSGILNAEDVRLVKK